MKTLKNPLTGILAILAVLFCLPAFAQYDDVYYDPGAYTRSSRTTTTSTTTYTDSYDSAVEPYDASNFDGEAFGYDDYSGFEYSSRIRRFRNPYAGFGYYDPVYVDQVYYGGFRPIGSTVLIYNSPYSYNSFRFNRFNRFNDPFFAGGFYDPFYSGFYGGRTFGFGRAGWNNGFNNGWNNGWNNGFNSWNNGFNNGFASGFGAAGGYYCPPTWGNGVTYNIPNAVNTSNRPGSRPSGTRGTYDNPGTNNRVPGNGRTYRDIDPGQTRTAPSRTNGRTPRDANQPESRTAPSTSPNRDRTPSTAPSRSTTRPSSSRPSRSTSPAPSTRPSRGTSTAPSTRPSRDISPSRSYSSPSRSASPSRSSVSPSRSSAPSRSSSAPSRSSSRRPN